MSESLVASSPAGSPHPPSTPSTPASEVEHEHEQQRMLILYATTTGNALDAAEQIFREAALRGFNVEIASVDEYPLVRCFYQLANLAKSTKNITGGPHPRRPCRLRRLHNGYGPRAPQPIRALGAPHARRSPARSLRRYALCCVWPRRHRVRKILLGGEKARKEAGELGRFRGV